jgi:hypothetical protein
MPFPFPCHAAMSASHAVWPRAAVAQLAEHVLQVAATPSATG